MQASDAPTETVDLRSSPVLSPVVDVRSRQIDDIECVVLSCQAKYA